MLSTRRRERGSDSVVLSEQLDAQVEPGTTDALIESQHGRYFTSEHSRDFVYVCAIKKSVNRK